MPTRTCQICKRRTGAKAMAEHHIVPVEVTGDAGIPESQTVAVCADCHREAHTWYVARVRHTEYDADSRRFRTRSYLEMVPEYQAVFDRFVQLKGARKARRRPA